MPHHLVISVPVSPAGIDALSRIPGITFEVVPPLDEPEAWPETLLQRCDGLICRIPPSNLGAAGGLRWIQLESVGFTQLFPHRLSIGGMVATNARGLFDIPIAEWNLAMMTALLRDFPGLQRNQIAHRWDRNGRFQQELRGRTVGLWGYGGIGRETARLAKAYGLRVHALTRTGQRRRDDCYQIPGTGDPAGTLPDRMFSEAERFDFLESLDFLILALPLTPGTEGLIGEAELRALGSSAYLLNPARGPIVQEAALLQALRERWIAGAALDTHYHYPMPGDHPLWDFPQVIMTPHISGSTGSTHFRERLWGLVAENARRLSRGEALLNRIAPADLSIG